MTDTTSDPLDDTELVHLALREAAANRTEQAIGYLKRALDIEPRNGKANYLLGALHAELGLYDRAIEEMTLAVDCEPELSAASFQLGLLHLTAGRQSDAEDAWRKLDDLGENHALFLFKRGLLSLAQDNHQACIDDLQRGMALNGENSDLNTDMKRIVERAQAALNDGGGHAGSTTASPVANLAAYQRDSFDHND